MAAVVEQAGREKRLAGVDTLILAGDLQALPVEQRPNLIPGDRTRSSRWSRSPRAASCRSPTPSAGCSTPTGRSSRSCSPASGCWPSRRRTGVLVASNPGGGLSLLETYSRNTVNELQRRLRRDRPFGRELTGRRAAQELPHHEVFLWEGHRNTLVKDWGSSTGTSR
ncbi:MAG: hypothetical protein U0736_08120 [Gemmataceae bacterium]